MIESLQQLTIKIKRNTNSNHNCLIMITTQLLNLSKFRKWYSWRLNQKINCNYFAESGIERWWWYSELVSENCKFWCYQIWCKPQNNNFVMNKISTKCDTLFARSQLMHSSVNNNEQGNHRPFFILIACWLSSENDFGLFQDVLNLNMLNGKFIVFNDILVFSQVISNNFTVSVQHIEFIPCSSMWK